jgi:hypothetical protein
MRRSSSYDEEEDDNVDRLIQVEDSDLNECLLVERYEGEQRTWQKGRQMNTNLNLLPLV